MKSTRFVGLTACVLLAVAGCGNAREDAATPAPMGEPAVATGVGSGAPATPGESGASSPAAAPASAEAPSPTAQPPVAPAARPAVVIAVQETNWPGIVAEVTEFSRKGNTLTAKFRLRNEGAEDEEPRIQWEEVYLMDLDAGKKYEVLKDEKGTYIALLRSGWNDRWYETLRPGQAMTLWMKFPAPPPEVTSVTLQVPGMPPFEDLPIQEG